jgi:hypothetical protein
MGHVHVTLGHDCHEVSVAQFVREVPSHTYDNDSAIKVTALEQTSQIVVGTVHDLGVAGSPLSCTRAIIFPSSMQTSILSPSQRQVGVIPDRIALLV